ncbi:MspA family porin [Rhodococcus kronopolitis]|uniref:MspA family porin n=1 Tax=Rhodococcus kronopolitis TaxID=1460226 RepID=A0ABV9FTI3_9NOCA
MTETDKARRTRRTAATRAVAAAGVVVTGMVLGNGVAAAGVDNASSIVDAKGDTIEVIQGDTRIDAVAPLDSSPLSREFFHSGYAEARITGPAAADAVGSKLTFGYQVGYPAAVTGGSIQINTPALGFEGENTSGALIGVIPDESLLLDTENRTELLGDIIPQQNFIVDLQPGGITDVPLVKEKAFDGPAARIRIGGVHGAVSGAVGQTTLRPYARLETADGDIVMTYGAPFRL